jgi:crossover junction endodeoxyribonuclease RusA
MTPLIFTVDGSPQGKQRPRMGKGGNVYTPAETRAYEKRFKVLALQAVRAHASWPFATSLPVVVWLDVYFEDERRRDLDNVLKAATDPGNGVIWKDDSQIHELHVYRHVDRARPRVEFKVEIMGPDRETHPL